MGDFFLGDGLGGKTEGGKWTPGLLSQTDGADGRRHGNFFLPRSVWKSPAESLLNAAAADEEKLSRMFRPQKWGGCGGKAPEFMAPCMRDLLRVGAKKSDIRMLCFTALRASKKRSQIDFFLILDLFPLLFSSR